MEKINKHNYEAYFLDYLEGNLSAEEKADLFAFLEKNPALKQELDLELNEVTLSPATELFDAKETIKVEDDEMLTLATADMWMLESVEKNLSASKQKELDDFVRKHQLEKTFSTYQATILKPDLTVVFDDKKKLKVATGIVIPLYARIASVAAMGLLLIGVYLNRSENENGMAVTAGEQQIFFASDLNFEHAPDSQNQFQNLADENVNSNQGTSVSPQKNNPDKNVNPENGPDNLVIEFPNNSPQQKDSSVVNEKMPDDEDKIVEQNQEDNKNNLPDNKDNDVVIRPFNSDARPSLVTEEPYKLVTNAASNFTNRDVEFTREKNTVTNEYVAYGFKIGNFEFERKKSE